MKKKEAPGQALQRVCQRHVAQALAHLRQAHLPESVHIVRKEIKRLRALFRLTRGGLSPKKYQKTAKAMRLASKPLAASRDARVIQKAFETLTGSKARQFPDIRSRLQTRSSHAEQNFANFDSGTVAKSILKKVRSHLDDLSLKRLGWSEVRADLEKSYTRGRNAWNLARRRPSPEHLHAWRKRVKDLWYQLDFLCPDWPPETRKMLAGLEVLGEELGADHDLVLLEQFTREQHRQLQEAAQLQILIDAWRNQHAAVFRRLGSRLYAQPPDVLCARLEKAWKSWHNG